MSRGASAGAVLPGLLAGVAACAGSVPMGPMLPAAPAEQSKCKVAASQGSPLVTEWPASEKANLESLMHSGAVAVSFSGCSMRVLPQCRLHGGYRWQRTTPSADTLDIHDEGDLYAKLPLGAASLEAELKRSGSLWVQTYVAGQLRLEGLAPGEVPPDALCGGATHIVQALSVGAFTLSTGGATSGKAGVEVVSLGSAGGGASRNASLLRSAGDAQVCASGTDQAPHPNCASPIQVFLAPIPGRVAEEGPPGTVKVDFVSAAANARWDVYIDDQVVCTTPCRKWVEPSRPVLLRAREEAFMSSPDKIRLGAIAAPPGLASVQLQAYPTATGERATGITFTALGGMAMITGVALVPLGSATGSDGMFTGGVITLVVGAAVTAGAIWMIVDSAPRAEVVGDTPGAQGMSLGSVPRVGVGPGVVFGTF